MNLSKIDCFKDDEIQREGILREHRQDGWMDGWSCRRVSLWKNALFVWMDGAMLVQHVAVSTVPKVDQPHTHSHSVSSKQMAV